MNNFREDVVYEDDESNPSDAECGPPEPKHRKHDGSSGLQHRKHDGSSELQHRKHDGSSGLQHRKHDESSELQHRKNDWSPLESSVAKLADMQSKLLEKLEKQTQKFEHRDQLDSFFESCALRAKNLNKAKQGWLQMQVSMVMYQAENNETPTKPITVITHPATSSVKQIN